MSTDLSPLETARFVQCSRVLSLMADGRNQKDACEEAGISVRQFRYWVQKQGGMEQLTELARDHTIDALLTVLTAYGKAIDRLVKIATDPNVRAQDQIRAIQEMRLMVNEVIVPQMKRGESLDEEGQPPASAAWKPTFLNAKITISPEIQQVIEMTQPGQVIDSAD